MCFREKDNGGSKRAYKELVNFINVFDDVNSVLYTVTNIRHKAGILLKISNFLRCGNLALFTR